MPAAESNGDGMEVYESGSSGDSGTVEDRNGKHCDVDGAVSIFFSDFIPLYQLFSCIEHFC